MSDSWDRVTALFEAARLLEPSTRGPFLDAACGTDGGIRSEIESLLAQVPATDGFLSDPPTDLIEAALRDSFVVLVAGQILNERYCVEEQMAQGGQAVVYRARDQLLSRLVVIKVLNSEGRRNEWLRSRLRQEMDALARIDHPGVVGILDTGQLRDGSQFPAIQYIDGVSLREALRSGPMEPRRAAAILQQAGSALAAAHIQGISHRDLKPENIMLQRLSDGTEIVKLIDFGIAKIERSEFEPGTTTVMLAGTVRYMAPEQFDGDNSPASDGYSLGLVVCEMLSGFPDPRALPPAVGRKVRRALEMALAFRPQERPMDVAKWSADVAKEIGQIGRRRPLLWFAAPACVLIIAGLMLAIIGRTPRATEDTARIIEKVGAFDPLVEGFQIHNELSSTVVSNPERTGYDAWRASTSSLGYYYRHLSEMQKHRALEHGWKLFALVRAEEGATTVGIDFAPFGKRFDINDDVESNADVVRLLTQIVPVFQGLEYRLSRRSAEYHQYEMRYDAGLQSAELWVDGKRVLSGYRGHSQFQDDFGLAFGVAVYKSNRGSASFQSVRFEINP